MLALEVAVEPADLLPLHNREDGIQGVEVRDLNVRRINVLGAAGGERNTPARVIPVLRRAGGHPPDAAEGSIVELEAHADVDESGTDRLEFLHDQPLRVTGVAGQEREGEAAEKV